jgi:hypothetical protein
VSELVAEDNFSFLHVEQWRDRITWPKERWHTRIRCGLCKCKGQQVEFNEMGEAHKHLRQQHGVRQITATEYRRRHYTKEFRSRKRRN